MNNEKLRKEYLKYRAKGGEEPFGQWCAFVKPLPEKEIREALLFTKRINKEFIDSQKDTIWTPDGRIKMNPEYIENAIRLRAFQKAQREADPEWTTLDALTKRISRASEEGQLNQEIMSVKREFELQAYYKQISNQKKSFFQKTADWILDKLPRLK